MGPPSVYRVIIATAIHPSGEQNKTKILNAHLRQDFNRMSPCRRYLHIIIYGFKPFWTPPFSAIIVVKAESANPLWPESTRFGGSKHPLRNRIILRSARLTQYLIIILKYVPIYRYRAPTSNCTCTCSRHQYAIYTSPHYNNINNNTYIIPRGKKT